MDDAGYKELIEAACRSQGLTIDSWDTEDGRPLAVLGQWRVTEESENEDEGIYADEEGELTASTVGAAEYRNLRVMFGLRKLEAVMKTTRPKFRIPCCSNQWAEL